MDTVAEQSAWFNPITYGLEFLASYGWYLVGVLAAGGYAWSHINVRIRRWRQEQEDADYHKNPDKYAAHAQAVERARQRQQERLAEESQRALELQKEREERKRSEAAERLKKYGASGGRLGSGDDAGYLPLSGGASTSSYRAPKRSACGGGGCGK